MPAKRRRRRMLDRHYHEIVPEFPPTMELPPEFERLVCVDTTNAAQWFYEESGQEEWDSREDFPCIAPPWPYSWFEFCGDGIVADTTGVSMVGSLGCLISAVEIREDRREEALQEDAMLQTVRALQTQENLRPQILQKFDLEMRRRGIDKYADMEVFPRWVCLAKVIMGHRKRIQHIGTLAYYVCEEGRDMPLLASSHYWLPPGKSPEEFHAYIEKHNMFLHSMILPVFFALSLFHCKNVHLEDLPPAPRYARKARKQKARGDVTYKTLVIDPLRAHARREAQEEDGSNKALHIVRGHFKDYRDGAGLFGKHREIYWWDMHARGDAELGKIEKDYKV